MNGWLETTLLALADYYVAGTLLLVVALIVVRLIAQPVRRIAACWATLVTLALLIPATLAPIWPRIGWERVIDFPEPAQSAMDAAPTTTAFPHAAAMDESVHGRESDESMANAPSHPTVVPLNVEVASGSAVDSSIPSLPNLTSESADVGASPLMKESKTTTGSWQSVGLLFWAGSASVSLWIIAGGVLARRLQRQSAPAPPAIQAQLNQLAANVGNPPPVMVHGRIKTAVAINALHPTIVLPELFVERASHEELQYALAHELAHIRHRDLWLLNAGRMLFVLLNAHPLFWWLRRVIRDNQELLADAYAARETERHKYAKSLLSLAQLGIDGPLPRLAAVGIWERPSQLTRRIKMLLDERFIVRLNCSRGFRAATFAGALGLAVVCSFLSLRAPGESAAVAEATEVVAVEETKDRDSTADIAQDETAKTEKPKVTEAKKPEQPSADAQATLTGRVLDEAGVPVKGAEVRALYYGAPAPVATGADGRFQLEVPLAAVRGRLALQALSDQGTQQTYYTYPRDPQRSEAPEGVELKLQPARQIVVRVVDAQGAPVEDADVVVTSSFRELDAVKSSNGAATLKIPHDVPISNVWAAKSGVGLDYFVFRRPDQPASDPYQLPQDHSGPFTLTLNAARGGRP